ncbi:hypothetical protein LOK74_04885 [Brevibacillus humidisoli]|uniref:hypothetical protein n=1 Tax=Brevibacillus humidisoli TaxID=2895522 RepID=UPI001E491558|nr:hypothetical protein [Brevibacillus humidisoli]UFJ41842.1 hypothetical protein LOK74_04885 [Brevibacillus humidisoli]
MLYFFGFLACLAAAAWFLRGSRSLRGRDEYVKHHYIDEARFQQMHNMSHHDPGGHH